MQERSSRMRKCLTAASAAMLLCLGGCASTDYVWYQQGKDRGTFKKDNLQCEEESALYAKYMDKRGDRDVIMTRMKDCMGLRGYLRVRSEDVPQGMEKFK